MLLQPTVSGHLKLPSIMDLPFTQMDGFPGLPALITDHSNERIELPQINNTNNKEITPTKGPWLPHEDELLRVAVENCHPILWDVVAESVPGRNAVQCKERWRYRLSPDVKRTRFEKWEDDFIVRERNRIGNHWTCIANRLPGRTSCAVKNRWYSVLKDRIV